MLHIHAKNVFLLDLNTRIVRGGKCECFICENRRKNGKIEVTVPMVECFTGNSVARGPENQLVERNLCNTCYAQIGKGKSHPCTK